MLPDVNNNIPEMKLYCYSIEGFKRAMEQMGYGRNDEKLLEKDNIAVISICCTDTNPEEYKGLFAEEHYFINKTGSPNVLNIEFDDLDPATWLGSGFDPDEASQEDFSFGSKSSFGNPPRAIDWEQSEKVVRFIENNIRKDFYVHCSAGVSRSQAVVRFILDCFPEYNCKTNPDNPCLLPNGHVLRMLKRTFMRDTLSHSKP